MPVHSIYLSKLSDDQREDLKRRLLEGRNGVCFICEEPIDLVLQRDALEIDHIIPIASGGKDEENNFALVHARCNRNKSASDLRVARVMARFSKIEDAANRGDHSGRGANLGHVLRAYGGAQKPLRLLIEDDSVRYSLNGNGGVQITTVPVWKDPLSQMSYCFLYLPLEYLHHDTRINPRSIGANLRELVEEFNKKRPQLHVALAWWGPQSEDEGNVSIFDGQHKAAAQILLGVKSLPIRLFIKPNLNVLLETNTNAAGKLRQVAFAAADRQHLGDMLFKERVEDYQHLRRLRSEDLSFSEADMVKLFRGEHREVIGYIVSSAKDQIARAPNNTLTDYVEWAGKTAEKPISYSTVDKSFYSEFLYMRPVETPLGEGLEIGTNPRQVEREQMIRLMSLFADAFFVGQWNTEIGGRKLEDRVLKGEPIPPEHLRAWRIAREEVLTNVLKWVRLAIEHYYAFNQEMVDKERLMHRRFPAPVWTMIETVLRNVGDLPCWIDTKLAQTIFGGKPNRDFWKKIFQDGVSPTGIRVLPRGLDLGSLITPRGE